MKPAYWIARSRILDEPQYMEYARQAGAAFAKLPGGPRMLARGGRFEVLEGGTAFHRFVLVEYPSMQAALDFYHSDAYQAAARLRWDGAGENELIIVEGV
jgi:uncharacterized protein (DUF1330 family)